MKFKALLAVSTLALMTACASTEQRADVSGDTQALAAYNAYKAGDLAQAERLYQASLSQNPQNSHALLGLGAIRERAGDLDAAEDLYLAAQREGQGDVSDRAYRSLESSEYTTDSDVASLASQNLERLYASRAAGATTVVTTYEAPVEDSYAVDTVSYGAPTDGSYENVGSYDSYAAGAGYSTGSTIPATYSETVTTYSEPVETYSETVVIDDSYTTGTVVDSYAPATVESYESVTTTGSYTTIPVESYDAQVIETYDVAPVGDSYTIESTTTYSGSSTAPIFGN